MSDSNTLLKTCLIKTPLKIQLVENYVQKWEYEMLNCSLHEWNGKMPSAPNIDAKVNNHQYYKFSYSADSSGHN